MRPVTRLIVALVTTIIFFYLILFCLIQFKGFFKGNGPWVTGPDCALNVTELLGPAAWKKGCENGLPNKREYALS